MVSVKQLCMHSINATVVLPSLIIKKSTHFSYRKPPFVDYTAGYV